MKAFIFATILAVAAAVQFKVSKDGKTCALLSLDGYVELVASNKDVQPIPVDLQFADAKLINSSTCDVIKLDLTKSAQMWFKFKANGNNWEVTPVSTFIPEEVFGTAVNETGAVTMNSETLKPFPSKESYTCLSPEELDFEPEAKTLDFNYTVNAFVSGFQIQSVEGEKFVAGKECAADAQYTCGSGGQPMIVMEGNFTLNISYFKNTGPGKVQNVSTLIYVPAPEDTRSTGECQKGATQQSLNIVFFKTWTLGFIFAKNKDNFYSITNLTLDYAFDDNLPGHNKSGNARVSFPVSKDYLKASTDGYYICNANLDKAMDGVILSSKDFKYRAFDDKSDGFSGTVSECSADEDSSSVVPIAVGAALAGLVVIVLVAYLIGRKRTRKTGYESV